MERRNQCTPQQQCQESSREKQEEVSTRFYHHRPGDHYDDRPWRPAGPASTLDREGLSSSQTCDPETLARISDRAVWPRLAGPARAVGNKVSTMPSLRQLQAEEEAASGSGQPEA